MTPASLHAARLDRVHRGLRRERQAIRLARGVRRAEGGRATFGTLAGWLGIPLVALAPLVPGGPGPVVAIILGVVAAAAAGHFVGCRAVALDPFLSLRAPSRPAFRAARWIVRLPWFAWTGAWLGGLARVAFPDGGAAAVALVAALPLLQAGLSGLHRILLARSAAATIRGAAYLGAGMIVPVLAVLAAVVPGVRAPFAVGAWVAAPVLVLLGIALARTGESVAPEDPEPGAAPRTVAANVGRLPRSHPGRTGVRGAALARARARLRLPPFPELLSALPRRFARLVIALLGPLLALLLLWIDDVWLAAEVVVGAALLAPSHLDLAPHPRLWLLAGSSRRVASARLRSLFFTAALPTLAVAAAATLLAGPTPIRRGALAGLAALFLYRAALPHLPWLPTVAVLAGTLVLPGDPYVTLPAAAAALGLLGLLRYVSARPTADLRWDSRDYAYLLDRVFRRRE